MSPSRSASSEAGNAASESFDTFYLREFRAMVALAYSVSGSASTAEDVAQEAMTRAYRSWAKISQYDKPGTWLRRVTVNLAISNRRRAVSETKARLSLGPPHTFTDPPTVHDEIWDAVKKLPARQRIAVALHYLEDRSIAEVADILGCAEATARVHLHRGRQTLHKMLQGSTA